MDKNLKQVIEMHIENRKNIAKDSISIEDRKAKLNLECTYFANLILTWYVEEIEKEQQQNENRHSRKS